MRRRNLGILITPYSTIEEHNLSIESSSMWGTPKNGETKPAWLTPDSLRKMPRGQSMAILLNTTINPFVFPGEKSAVDVRVRQRQAITESYHKTVTVTLKDSVAVVMTLMGLVALGIIVLLATLLPGIYWQWRDQKDARETSAIMELIDEPIYADFKFDISFERLTKTYERRS